MYNIFEDNEVKWKLYVTHIVPRTSNYFLWQIINIMSLFLISFEILLICQYKKCSINDVAGDTNLE